MTEAGCLEVEAALFVVSAGFFLIAPGLGEDRAFTGADAALDGAEATFFLTGVADVGFFAVSGFGAGAGSAFLGAAASILFWGDAVLLVVVKVFETLDLGGARYIWGLVTRLFPPATPLLNPRGLLAVAARTPSACVQSIIAFP